MLRRSLNRSPTPSSIITSASWSRVEKTGGFSPMWLGMYTFFVDHKTGDLVYRGFADWDHPCTPMTDEELAKIKSVDALAEEAGVHD